MVVAICGCTYAVAQHFMHLPDKTINFFDGKPSIHIRYRRFSFSGHGLRSVSWRAGVVNGLRRWKMPIAKRYLGR